MKNKKLRILILITFLIALTLSISGYFYKTKKDVENSYQQIERPIYKYDNYEIDWPKISTNKLSKSIKNYDGEVDIDKFKGIFESEFKSSIEVIDPNWFTFEYIIIANEIKIYVDSNLKMFENKVISNPSHIYTYKLKNNSIIN